MSLSNDAIDLLDGWRFKCQQLEGNIRGRNETIQRKLGVALDLLRSCDQSDFAIKAAIERMEDVLELTK